MEQINNKSYVFCYGSNGQDQVRQRVLNDQIVSTPAIIENYSLAFSGIGKRWDNGAISTIIPMEGQQVIGSVVQMSDEEIKRMDPYEGCNSDQPTDSEQNEYNRIIIDAYIVNQNKEKQKIQTMVYIRNEKEYFCKPGERYLQAIQKNRLQAWGQLLEEQHKKIVIRRADNGEIQDTWENKDI